jgi:hypothetical protein
MDRKFIFCILCSVGTGISSTASVQQNPPPAPPSDDPAWKYYSNADQIKKNYVKCNFCDKVMSLTVLQGQSSILLASEETMLHLGLIFACAWSVSGRVHRQILLVVDVDCLSLILIKMQVAWVLG